VSPAEEWERWYRMMAEPRHHRPQRHHVELPGRLGHQGASAAVRRHPEGVMSGQAPTAADWGPYPSVTLGAGRWRWVIKALRRNGSTEALRIAATIERQISEDAERIRARFGG
jgi:hypothetical protein